MKNCTILIGDDEYSKEEFINKEINSKIDPAWKDFNLIIFNADEMKNEDISKIIESSSTPPFGPGNKLVIVNNINSKEGNDTKRKHFLESEDLLNFLKKGLIEGVYLILSCISLDERKRIIKNIISLSDKQIFNLPKPWELTKKVTPWLEDYIRKNNKKIEKSAADDLVLSTNGDKRRIINEIEKLILYCDDKSTITYDDVKLLVKSTETNIFKLIELLSKKDVYSALIELSNLLLYEEGIVISPSLNSNIRYVYNLKNFYEDKMTLEEISKKLKKHSYIIEKDLKSWRNFSTEKLRNILEELINIESKFKSTRVNQKLEFEKFIIKHFS